MKQLSIVIVNYGSSHLLNTCLDSIARASGSDVDVFVVNNGSHRELEPLFQKPQPWIHLIQNPTNVGFAAAANIGFRISRREFVLLLNPDVLVEGQAPTVLLDTLESNTSAAIALPRLNNPDGSLQ